MSRKHRDPRPSPAEPARVTGAERLLIVTLLLLHAVLAGWGATRNSVTFDENFHVPSGVALVARGEPGVSPVNPPLVKSLHGLAALAAGARVSADSVLARRDQWVVGEHFMRLNAARYHPVFLAARAVNVLLSLMLAAIVWWLARQAHGARAGAFALGLWALAPEALAHAGFATMDTPTALLWLACAWAADRFVASPGWRHALALFALVAAFAATRFSVVLVAPLLSLLAVWRARAGAPVAWWRIAASLVALPMVIGLAWVASYPARFPAPPLASVAWESAAMQRLATAAPQVRLPLPEDLLRGLDRQSFHGQRGSLTTYFMGRAVPGSLPEYFPTALALKWPLALVALVLLRLAWGLRPQGRGQSSPVWAIAIAVQLGALMLAGIDAGVRYALPVLPLACLAVSPMLAASHARSAWGRAASGLALVAMIEGALDGPYWVSSFNALAGPPQRAQWRLNDSNLDWGQGLIALREELARRGVRKLQYTLHGTVDPLIYGIHGRPYVGGALDPDTEYLAVSSYFFVGLPARILTDEGYSPWVLRIDMRPFWGRVPDATVGGSIHLFRVR